MDLAHPLTSLIPSLDAVALEVLAGTESALGTSRIHRLAGRGSRAGLQKVLDRLVEHGLVASEATNNGYSYRLNRHHLLAPAIRSALSVRRELLTRLTEAVTDLTPAAVHGSIFGSFARGEGRSHSDIDLFLVMPVGYDNDPSRWQRQLQQLEDHVLEWTGNRLEVLVVDRDQLTKAAAENEPVLASLRQDAIHLHGTDLDALLTTKAAR